MIPAGSDDAILVARLQASLRRLPHRRREIYLRSCVERWSYAEIAAAYGISIRRVRRHVAKALLILVLEVLLDSPQPWWRRWSP